MKSTFALACVIVGGLAAGAHAQSLTYSKGQNVAPAFEGWEQDADGTKYFVFGYMNRNWVEEVDIPTGPENSFSPGGNDLGQPTHFLPRRNRFVFRIPVPKTFTEKDEMIWTLTSHGVTEKAWATIRPDYLLDDVVKASETGALGAGTSSPEVRANKAPVVKLDGPASLTAKVGVPVTLTAWVTDDGIPRMRVQPAGFPSTAASPAAGAPATPPPGAIPIATAPGAAPTQSQVLLAQRRNPSLVPPTRITVGKVNGLHFGWFVYRGAGAVTFSPEQVKSWEDTRAGANSPWAPLWTPPVMPKDGRMVVQATFSEPGTYVLRGLADDGALFAGQNVTVTVTR